MDYCTYIHRPSSGEYSYTVVKDCQEGCTPLSALKKVATYNYVAYILCTKVLVQYMAATLTSTNMEIVSISSIRHDVD